MTVSAPHPGSPPDPIAGFLRDSQAFRVPAPGASSMVGWALTLLVILDTLLNVRGHGSLSMLVAFHSGRPLSQVTGAAIGVSVVQFGVLGVAALCLRASPWPGWLRDDLRASEPARVWLAAARAALSGREADARLGRQGIRNLVIFGISLVVLSPIATLGKSAISYPILWLLLLALAYSATKLAVAVAGRARQDSASAAGLIVGIAVPLIAAAYADSMVVALRTTPDGLIEFSYYQLGVLAIAIASIMRFQMGAVGDTGLVTIEMDPARNDVLRELPDMTVGVYRPFEFAVSDNGEKIVLLSRPVAAAHSYAVHVTLDRHDPTSGRWLILNLSALERSVGPLVFEWTGRTKYLQVRITLSLVTTPPERYLGTLRRTPAHIPVEEFAAVKGGIVSSGDVVGKLRAKLEAAIGSRLDDSIRSSPFGRQVSTMGGLQARMRSDVSELEQAFGMIVARFQVLVSSSLRLGREQEIHDGLMASLQEVAPSMNRIRQTYDVGANLDQSIESAHTDIQGAVAAKLREVMQSTSYARNAPGRDLHLIDMIELGVQSVSVEWTNEARALDAQITALFERAAECWTRCVDRLGTIAKERSERDHAALITLLNSPTPFSHKRPLLDWFKPSIASPSGQPATPVLPGQGRPNGPRLPAIPGMAADDQETTEWQLSTPHVPRPGAKGSEMPTLRPSEGARSGAAELQSGSPFPD